MDELNVIGSSRPQVGGGPCPLHQGLRLHVAEHLPPARTHRCRLSIVAQIGRCGRIQVDKGLKAAEGA
ncbi:hypothetical protein ACWGTO_33755 [Mesorhizobium sp. PL10]